MKQNSEKDIKDSISRLIDQMEEVTKIFLDNRKKQSMNESIMCRSLGAGTLYHDWNAWTNSYNFRINELRNIIKTGKYYFGIWNATKEVDIKEMAEMTNHLLKDVLLGLTTEEKYVETHKQDKLPLSIAARYELNQEMLRITNMVEETLMMKTEEMEQGAATCPTEPKIRMK